MIQPPNINQLLSDVDTSAESINYERDKASPPSFAFSSGMLVLFDALRFHCAGGGVSKEDWSRASWGWRPHCISGEWRAGALRMEAAACMTGGDTALVRVSVTNTGSAPYSGRLIAEGDAKNSNLSLHIMRGGILKDPRWQSDVKCDFQDGCVVAWQRAKRTIWSDLVWDRFLKPEDFDRGQRLRNVESLTAFHFGEGWEFRTTDQSAAGWSAERSLRLKAGETFTALVAFAGKALGSVSATDSDRSAVTETARRESVKNWNEALSSGEAKWRGILSKVPAPPSCLSPEWRTHYHKAWTVPFFNLISPCDFGFLNLKYPSVMCNKLADSCFTVPASWEASLGALLVAMVEPETAASVIEGVYSTMDDDGFISEMIGNNRKTQLANVEPSVAWMIHKLGAGKGFLERIYPAAWRNNVYRHYHPNWSHMSGLTCRNMAYNYHASSYLRRAAELLGRPQKEIERLNDMIFDTELAINAMWDDKGGFYRRTYDPAAKTFNPFTHADVFVSLAGAARPEKRKAALESIPKHFLTDTGVIRSFPTGLDNAAPRNDKEGRSILKPSNYLFLMPALRAHAPALFEKAANATLDVIARDGDFWEEYDIYGRGYNNGPDSIFGAFGFIWTALSMDGRAAEILDNSVKQV
jgi:hypothetical protein